MKGPQQEACDCKEPPRPPRPPTPAANNNMIPAGWAAGALWGLCAFPAYCCLPTLHSPGCAVLPGSHLHPGPGMLHFIPHHGCSHCILDHECSCSIPDQGCSHCILYHGCTHFILYHGCSRFIPHGRCSCFIPHHKCSHWSPGTSSGSTMTSQNCCNVLPALRGCQAGSSRSSRDPSTSWEKWLFL